MNRKTHQILVYLLITILLGACSFTRLEQQPHVDLTTQEPGPFEATLTIEEYFPLRQGAYWIYEGLVKWTEPNSANVVEETIQWKMEVTGEIHVNNISTYLMRGAPWDLAWYTQGQEPSQYGLIRVGGKLYRTSLETAQQLMEPLDPTTPLVQESQIFLEFPLIEGKKICETTALLRADDMYCWVVGAALPQTDFNIKGLDSAQPLTRYPLYYQTLPDYTSFQFIPGVGISNFHYVHHGTTSEVDVRLVEYYPGD